MSFDESDVRSALSVASAVGDDRIQEAGIQNCNTLNAEQL